jgi:hypothetical protein
MSKCNLILSYRNARVFRKDSSEFNCRKSKNQKDHESRDEEGNQTGSWAHVAPAPNMPKLAEKRSSLASSFSHEACSSNSSQRKSKEGY